MQTVAILNNKGGVGKTTTAVNLAYNLTELGQRVLLIDMDPQGNASLFFKKYDLSKKSIYDVMMGQERLSRAIRRTHYDNLDIIPANIKLQSLNENTYHVELYKKLWNVKERYEFCIIDCPPALSEPTRAALEAAELTIIPIKATEYAKAGLSTVMDIAEQYNSSVQCLWTMYSRGKHEKEIMGEIIERGYGVYENVIRRSAAVERSELRHKPLQKCARTSPATLDYMEFTKEFLEDMGAN